MNNDEMLVFNGLDGATGGYLFESISVDGVAKVAKGDKANADDFQYIHTLKVLKSERHFGVDGGEAIARDVTKAGWGIVIAADMPDRDAVIKALQLLLEYRKQQVGDKLYKELSYITGTPGGIINDTLVIRWLARNGAAPGTVKPEVVPYYLLLVGSPEHIPFDFQYTLDVQYAVGRICFDTPDDYARYAQQVVAREKSHTRQKKQVVLFGAQNKFDPATESGIKYLIDPLDRALKAQYQQQAWDVCRIDKQDATKARLSQLLHQVEQPAFIMTSSHGVGFDQIPDPRQKQDQGALVCSDWPGPYDWNGEVIKDFYFSADDLQPDADLKGAMLFLFACYSGGTPRFDNFMYQATGQVKEIAPADFISALPKRLLLSGASAVMCHVERAWGFSFAGEGGVDNTATFKGVLNELFAGIPVGHAMSYLNDYYATMESQMGVIHEKIKSDPFYKPPVNEELVRIYVGKNDARNYILLGDPACRLKVLG